MDSHLWALEYRFGLAARHCGKRPYALQQHLLDYYLPKIGGEETAMRELQDAKFDLMLAMRLRRWRDAVRMQDYDDMTFRYQKIIEHVTEQMRQARIDEHKILAALDEEGRKARYLELSNE